MKIKIMKTFSIMTCACLFIFSGAFCQDFKKLDPDAVNNHSKETAGKFATVFLTDLKNGSVYQFKDEATGDLKKALTEDMQKQSYQNLKDQFGDFESLNYTETWIYSKDTTLRFFRFKADFNKSNGKLEVRVVLNGEGKIAGIWITPWKDTIQ